MVEKEQHRPAPSLPEMLDERGKALMELVRQVFSPFSPQIDVVLDEVTVTIKREQLLDVARLLKEEPRLSFDYLRCLTVVDYKERFQVVYHLASIEKRHKIVVKVDIPLDNPTLPSLTSVWKATDWFEREGHDLFGVVFEGHPNLKPLLLYEGFEGYPGRKSYPLHDYNEW